MKKILTGLFLFSSILGEPVYATDSLTATIIGSGSPRFNENRASASVLISAGETKLLVDMGNGTQANLYKLGIKARDLSGLFFTHHHLDHNEEFVPIFIGALMGKDEFTIVGPTNTVKFAETNLALYEEDISYRLGKTQRHLDDREHAFDVKDLVGGESFMIDDIKVSTVEVPHTIHTVAYRFDYKGESVVISGDLTDSDDLPKLAQNADFLIIDSGGMIMKDGRQKNKSNKKAGGGDKQDRAHLNLDDSSSMANEANVKNLVYTHFNSTVVDTEASLKEIRKNYSGHVIFGEDLMVLNNANKPSASGGLNSTLSYPIVDTGQKKFYGDDDAISLPTSDDDFFGQDASYTINDPSYTDNNNGTITDNITGLMWQKALGDKLTFEEAQQKIVNFTLAGKNDWRIATVKDLYSLIQFTGKVKGAKAITPFIDTRYFEQPLGGANEGEREIDAQVWSSTEYVGKTMNNDDTVFGVNFVDGRIKGYPKYNPRTKAPNKMYFRFVRGNTAYGKNDFEDQGNGTILDAATGLTWQQLDSTKGMNWEEALQYAEELTLGGYVDWRLPNAKELQSIVDYDRSPETSNSAAINPIFKSSTIKNEAGEKDYPYYWSSTTHLDGPVPESQAVYVAFGKAMGEMRGNMMDVHGAGSQRSDPKTGSPMSRGPQGDMIRVDNYVRVVRGGYIEMATSKTTEIDHQYLMGSAQSKAKAGKKSSSTNKFINRLDKNGDGKVSRSEFKRGTEKFDRLDNNNDGFISVDEAPTGPVKKDGKKR